MSTDRTDAVLAEVHDWLEQAVLGLGLCPFAAGPWRAGQVRLTVTPAAGQQALLEDLYDELRLLDGDKPDRPETTLLIAPWVLREFADYNRFLDLAEALLEEFGFAGRYQLASFHPEYRFAGSSSADPANLSNRAPYPILHLLRESSVDRALAGFANPQRIYAANIARLRALSEAERRRLFGARAS